MASSLRKPDILSFEGNVADNWRVFEQEYNIYIAAAHPDTTAETFQFCFVDLANKADSRDFGEMKEELVRDRIVCAIQSDTVRKLLLREPDLTLEKAKEICLMYELADKEKQREKH